MKRSCINCGLMSLTVQHVRLQPWISVYNSLKSEVYFEVGITDLLKAESADRQTCKPPL